MAWFLRTCVKMKMGLLLLSLFYLPLCMKYLLRWRRRRRRMEGWGQKMFKTYKSSWQKNTILWRSQSCDILSAQHASAANIYVTTTKELISQADGNGMKVVGQTKSPLIIYGIFQGAMIKINLGRVIVFKNLEEDLLLGEPSCKDNKIWTMSHKSSVHWDKPNHLHHSVYPCQ